MERRRDREWKSNLQPREFCDDPSYGKRIEIGEIIHFDVSKQEIRKAIIPRANWKIIASRYFTIGIELSESSERIERNGGKYAEDHKNVTTNVQYVRKVLERISSHRR